MFVVPDATGRGQDQARVRGMSEPIDLRLGDYRETLADVTCDALICDPPYSARTHAGYRTATDYKKTDLVEHAGHARHRPGKASGGCMPRNRFELQYPPITEAWVSSAVEFWVPRVRSWFVIFSDHVGARWWADAFDASGLVVFAPVPWVRVDSAPRFAADGPANSCEWITVARPKGLPTDRRSRPGYYMGSHQGLKVVTGGKPLNLMRSIVLDYSLPGDTIVDFCAGGATTLIASVIEGRRAIGSELDPETHAKAMNRIATSGEIETYAPSDVLKHAKQARLF